MKKIILPFCIFLFVISFAQNQKFFYQYESIHDSTNIERKAKALMVLDVSNKGSLFIDTARLQGDSIRKADLKIGKEYNPKWFGGNKMIVVKKYPSYQTFAFEALYKDPFQIEEKRKITWKILPDKDVIKGFNVQKATTNIFGREWIAWFTTEIPIQDGPYKFHGLPGLILKISDTKNYYVFDFVGSKKTADKPDLDNVKYFGDTKPILIDNDKFKKMYQEDRANTNVGSEITGNDPNSKYINSQKQEVSKAEFFKTMNENRARAFKANNNPLELDLLKK